MSGNVTKLWSMLSKLILDVQKAEKWEALNAYLSCYINRKVIRTRNKVGLLTTF